MTNTTDAGTILARPPAGAVRRLLRRELRLEWRIITVAVAATMIGSTAIALGPAMVRMAIDDGMGDGDRSALTTAVIVYLVALAGSGLAAGLRATLMARASERFIDRLRVASLAGILRLDLRTFERIRRGDLLARVSADTEALSAASRWVVPEAIRNITDLIAALIAVAILDPLLALVTLVAVPPMAAAGRVLRIRSAIVYPRYRDEIGALVGQVSETVEGTDVVRAHGRMRDRLAMLGAANERVTDRYMDGTSMRNRFYASITLTRVAATSIVLVAASLFAISGRLSVGTAAAGVLAVSTVFGPLAWFTELLDDVLSAKAALHRVVATTEITEHGGGVPLPASGDLVLDRVTFGYDPQRPVLRDVSLVIPAGARLAIVGATGAGKSTLARLASGLTRPDEGVVSFAGIDLATADPESRRRRLCYVLQESVVLTGTIADNVRLTAPTMSDDEVTALAESIDLGEWVRSHPDGVARTTGHAGSGLSVGERQLVGVLRLAAADPAVVILDEATAVLDPITEQLVGAALDRVLGARTVLVIAHRIDTARRASAAIRVDIGRVQPISIAELDDQLDAPGTHRS